MVLIRINFKNEEIYSSSLINGGDILAVGNASGDVRLLKYKKNLNSIEKFKLHELEITKLYAIKNRLLSCSRDARLKIWDIHKQKVSKTYDADFSPINDLDVSGNYIITGDESGAIRLWDFRIKNSPGKIKHGFNLFGCRFLNNPNLFVGYGLTKSLYLWDMRMSKAFLNKSQVLKDLDDFLISLSVSNNSDFIFILDSKFKIHRIRSQIKRNSYHCYCNLKKKKRLNFVKTLPKLNLDEEDKFILNGDLKGKTYIRSQKNGKLMAQFNDHLDAVKEVIFNSSKKIFSSCGLDGSVLIKTF